MTRKFVIAGVAALLLGGAVGSPALAGAEEPRPIRGAAAAEFYVDGFCEDGRPRQVIEGGGIASHLGRYTAEGGACLTDPATPPSVTWTAANGDEIHIVFVTVPIAPPSDDERVVPIQLIPLDVDGTGRFEDVQLDAVPTGTVTFDDPLVPVAGHIEFTFEGTITYDASGRSN